MRQMIQARYSFGYYPNIVTVILNMASIMGFTMISAVVGGQCLVAVSSNSISTIVRTATWDSEASHRTPAKSLLVWNCYSFSHNHALDNLRIQDHASRSALCLDPLANCSPHLRWNWRETFVATIPDGTCECEVDNQFCILDCRIYAPICKYTRGLCCLHATKRAKVRLLAALHSGTY